MDKNKLPSIVTIAMLTLITVIFWIFFSVFRLLTTKPGIKVSDDILRPISPTLDQAALNKLEARVYVSEGELGNLPATRPSPAATPIPTATQSPAPTQEGSPSPSATSSPSSQPTATATPVVPL